MKRPTITAHAGSMGLPDNTLEAIRAGIEAGADIVEFDLSFTVGGAPVLSHDEPQGGEPTLADAFGILRAHPAIRANIDLKRLSDHLYKVQPLAEEYGVSDRIFFTGINEDWIPEVRRQCPGVPYYLNRDIDESRFGDEAYYEELAALTARVGALGLNIHFSGAHPALSRILHEAGLELSLWTVDEPDDIRAVLETEPDNVTTRRPDLTLEIIRKA
ncbi:MAG: glycerophosphodiester phosphodiesterase [Clostridia bacterium]|nr:glycerophosphodiester phosphodiesterase [Clostridia bacterium]